ncbi:MAG: glycosyltransferase family 1 protein [Agathobacter sp.]
MKVLMVCTVDLGKNGIGSWIKNYSLSLQKEGCQIDIVAAETVDDITAKTLEEKGCHVYALSDRKKNTPAYMWKLFSLIRKEKYQIVHVHGNSCTMAIDLWAAMLAGCKHRIAHSHNTSCEHMRGHKLLRPFFEMACNGRFACGDLAGKWLFEGKDFLEIKNGIDLSVYEFSESVRNRMRKFLQLDEKSVLYGHVGLFSEIKNQLFIVKVFEQIIKKKENAKLVLIGEGELKEQVEAYVKEKNLQGSVFFTGNVNNVPDYLQAMDYFVLPSLHEGLPFVLIEAQAAGVPCVVSENVSQEVNISGKVVFLPLEESQWVSWFEKESEIGRIFAVEELKNSGFDINENAKLLKKYYYEMINKSKRGNHYC